MKTICYFDEYHYRANGLFTYTNYYKELLEEYNNYELIIIRFNAPVTTEYYDNSVRCFEFDFKADAINEDLFIHSEIFNFLNTISNEIILHFNWYSHLQLNYLIKSFFTVKSVLVVHCLQWRDLVDSDITLFNHIEKKLTIGESLSGMESYTINHEMHNYHYLDEIITVSDFAKKNLNVLFKIPNSKITTIYNGLYFYRKKNNKKKLRRQFNYSSDDIIFLYVGSISRRKGIFDFTKVFLEIAKKYKNLKLLICGDGKLQDLFKLVGLSNNIKIIGPQEKNVVFNLYNLADIGIVPSYIEQCSFTVLEMLSNQLPIILSKTDALPELYDSPYTINISRKQNSFSRLNETSIKNVLESAIYSKKDMLSVAKNNYLLGSKKFDIVQTIKKTTEVYSKKTNRASKGKTIVFIKNLEGENLDSIYRYFSLLDQEFEIFLYKKTEISTTNFNNIQSINYFDELVLNPIIQRSKAESVLFISEFPINTGAFEKLNQELFDGKYDVVFGSHTIFDGLLYETKKSKYYDHLWYKQTLNAHCILFNIQYLKKNILSSNYGQLYLLDLLLNKMSKINFSIIDYPVSIFKVKKKVLSENNITKDDLYYYFSIIKDALLSREISFKDDHIVTHIEFIFKHRYRKDKLKKDQQAWYKKILEDNFT